MGALPSDSIPITYLEPRGACDEHEQPSVRKAHHLEHLHERACEGGLAAWLQRILRVPKAHGPPGQVEVAELPGAGAGKDALKHIAVMRYMDMDALLHG
jgi:hypothetical protein